MFDGHGGVDAAIYASIHLHVNMVHQEMFQHDPAEALCRAFRVTDERFVQKAAREVIEKPGREGLDSESINWQILCMKQTKKTQTKPKQKVGLVKLVISYHWDRQNKFPARQAIRTGLRQEQPEFA